MTFRNREEVAMTEAPAGRDRYRIEALARGLEVLMLFGGSERSLRTSEIAARTGVPLPTTFRVVSTLVGMGFLERDDDGSLRPGLAVLALGSAALRSSSLLEASDRPLRRLADLTGETINLGVLSADRTLYVARLRNADLVTANVAVGTTLPAPYTSMGKLLLAHLEDDEVARRLTPESFPAGAGPHAVRELDEVMAHIRRIRQDGYSIQDEELAQGLRSISVAVLARDGTTLAALNVAVSASRHAVETLVPTFLEPLQAAAAEISMRLQNS
ncbi:pca regulon transcriptional regulator PcaR [soil metagenome]